MERAIEAKFSQTLKTFRCCAVMGARQVGKSFFLSRVARAAGGEYASLDDPRIREEVDRDPVLWIRRRRRVGRPFVIDEAIKSPAVFEAVKVVVDQEDPVPTQIVLAGSGNYLLLRQIKESLAGRVGLLRMFPLAWSELRQASARRSPIAALFEPETLAGPRPGVPVTELNREREQLLTDGAFPEVWVRRSRDFTEGWISHYFDTYVLPLALHLFRIGKQPAFERVFRHVSLRTGRLLNYSDIAAECDLSSATVKQYIHYLEAMMLCEEVGQYYRNPIKRLVKMPKVHMLDPSFAMWSLGLPRDLGGLRASGQLGAVYESWIVAELRKLMEYESQHLELTTWRTRDQAEVDLIISRGVQSVPLEIKLTRTVRKRDLSGLKAWLAAHAHETPAAYVVYCGAELTRLDEKIWAIPDHYLLGVS